VLSFIANLIPLLFNILFFFVPIVLYPYSFELFEFNKIILVYTITILVCLSWIVRMIIERKIIFRRTIFDIPLLLFLGSQILSTLTSIDFRTSLLGYYSRFNGGLLSTISYLILYWALVSNLDKEKTIKALKFLLYSGVLVSIYGVLQHLGIDKDVWVQDVQNRVFSTLGQPNWLAAFLIVLIPLTWFFLFKASLKSKKFLIWGVFLALFTLAFSYTKSRSGLLGLLVSLITFSGLSFYYLEGKKITKELTKKVFVVFGIFFACILIGGTAYTPNIENLLSRKGKSEEPKSVGPALEVGGTESGEIRKIVWKGAIDLWKKYPIFGSGVETFAYSYYQTRPVSHNLVSEWDFLYNKAHNELLNIAATTGSVGIIAYLYFIVSVLIYFIKRLKTSPTYLDSALVAGFGGIFVTNFFGFSVVPTNLLLFLIPAFSLSYSSEERVRKTQGRKLLVQEKLAIILVMLLGSYFLFSVARYWLADFSFSKGKAYNDGNDPVTGRASLVKAISLSPHEAIFWDEISQSDALIAVALNETGETEEADKYALAAIDESGKAVSLSPANLNLKRNRANLFIKLSALDPSYLENARDTLLDAISMAPTEAKLYFNLGLTYARLGELDKALSIFEKTVRMKPNYYDARLAYALVLIDMGEKVKAREELNYILTNIAPNDAITRQTLEEIK
jgi:O-antigen ligase